MFDLVWFQYNERYAKSKLDFGARVQSYLNNEINRIKITKEEVRLWTKKNRSWIKERIIPREGSVLVISPQVAIQDPFVYAVAIKMGFLTFEKLPNISKWFLKDGYKAVVKKRVVDGITTEFVKIVDKYGNSILVNWDFFSKLYNKIYQSKIGRNKSFFKKKKESFEDYAKKSQSK